MNEEIKDEPKKKVIPEKVKDMLMGHTFTVMNRDGDTVGAMLAGRLNEYPRLCFNRSGFRMSFEVSWQTAHHCFKTSSMIRE